MATRKATPAKSTTSRAKTITPTKRTTAVPKPVAKQVTPANVMTETSTVSTMPELKKQELVDMVVTRSGIKKKFAKPVVEAVMEILASSLEDGRSLNLPPLGKIKQNRTKESSSTRVIIAKIRQNKATLAALKDTVPEAAE